MIRQTTRRKESGSGQPSPTLEFERELGEMNPSAEYILGFDEVGRGALAGPVMVGVAMMRCPIESQATIPSGLRDSKLLIERRREEIFGEVGEWVAGFAVGSATNAEIDEWGIGHALGVAALRGLDMLSAGVEAGAPALALAGCIGILDGPYDYITRAASERPLSSLPHEDFSATLVPQVVTKVKADQTCAVVSAASVLAKVTRDRLMESLASLPEYSVYGWASNKGYGTVKHRLAIREVGACDLHRVSWHLV